MKEIRKGPLTPWRWHGGWAWAERRGRRAAPSRQHYRGSRAEWASRKGSWGKMPRFCYRAWFWSTGRPRNFHRHLRSESLGRRRSPPWGGRRRASWSGRWPERGGRRRTSRPAEREDTPFTLTPRDKKERRCAGSPVQFIDKNQNLNALLQREKREIAQRQKTLCFPFSFCFLYLGLRFWERRQSNWGRVYFFLLFCCFLQEVKFQRV